MTSQYSKFTESIGARKFTYLGAGSFREVYARRNIVIKIPMTTDGLNDNIIEARAWKKYKNKPTSMGAYLAPCRLLPNGCLMMVKVNDEFTDEEYKKLDDLSWTSDIDAQQVGKYKNKIVAYDYALDTKERYEWEKEFEVKSEFFHGRWILNRPHLIEPF